MTAEQAAAAIDQITLRDNRRERGTRHLVTGPFPFTPMCPRREPGWVDMVFGSLTVPVVPPGYRAKPYHWGTVNGRLILFKGPDPFDVLDDIKGLVGR